MPFDIFIASDAHCTLWCLRHWHIPIYHATSAQKERAIFHARRLIHTSRSSRLVAISSGHP